MADDCGVPGCDGALRDQARRPAKDERWVIYGERRPAERVFGEVTRCARDGAWADFKFFTWAVMWTKRMTCPLPDGMRRRDWGVGDLKEQERDHVSKLREEGRIG